ncbi:MAG: hypothetical protein LBE12_07895 [Planctomycetaceae bacterium]|nr:hypothetical protein [Planctomycetaceae bacterium]
MNNRLFTPDRFVVSLIMLILLPAGSKSISVKISIKIDVTKMNRYARRNGSAQ